MPVGIPILKQYYVKQAKSCKSSVTTLPYPEYWSWLSSFLWKQLQQNLSLLDCFNKKIIHFSRTLLRLSTDHSNTLIWINWPWIIYSKTFYHPLCCFDSWQMCVHSDNIVSKQRLSSWSRKKWYFRKTPLYKLCDLSFHRTHEFGQ